MVSKKHTCNICLESVRNNANLNLNCECQYYVHYKCYYKWWKKNKTCIICHSQSPRPTPYKYNKKLKNKRKIKQININNNFDNEIIQLLNSNNIYRFIIKDYIIMFIKITFMLIIYYILFTFK